MFKRKTPNIPTNIMMQEDKGSWAWLRTPLVPALGRQKQADFWVRGQPDLQSEFQDSQGYTEKPCLEKTEKNQRTQDPIPSSYLHIQSKL